MTFEYGKPLHGMAFGDQRLFPSDDSAWGESWQPPEPDATATLWRYMSFAKFCSLLERRQLFFALVSDMADKFEGFISPPTSRELGDIVERAERIGWIFLREITQNALINCWTEADHESSLMWTSYANTEGVAIRTTFQDLQASLFSIAPTLPVTFGKVAYVDHRLKELPRFSHAPLFHKRVEYRGEEEVRATLPSPPWEVRLDLENPNETNVLITLDSDVAKQRGRYISADLAILIKEVVLHPHSEAWFGRLVQSVVDRSPISVHVAPSSLR